MDLERAAGTAQDAQKSPQREAKEPLARSQVMKAAPVSGSLMATRHKEDTRKIPGDEKPCAGSAKLRGSVAASAPLLRSETEGRSVGCG